PFRGSSACRRSSERAGRAGWWSSCSGSFRRRPGGHCPLGRGRRVWGVGSTIGRSLADRPGVRRWSPGRVAVDGYQLVTSAGGHQVGGDDCVVAADLVALRGQLLSGFLQPEASPALAEPEMPGDFPLGGQAADAVLADGLLADPCAGRGVVLLVGAGPPAAVGPPRSRLVTVGRVVKGRLLVIDHLVGARRAGGDGGGVRGGGRRRPARGGGGA